MLMTGLPPHAIVVVAGSDAVIRRYALGRYGAGGGAEAPMLERLDVEHGRAIRADLQCVLCMRTAGSVQGQSLRPSTPMSLRVQDPRHLAAIRRLRCPYCSGRLWLQNSEEVYVARRPLPPEELRPRRGRPPKLAGGRKSGQS